jgi:RNase P subunit RPR2
MQIAQRRCPKCQGYLYRAPDVGSLGRLPPEWTCLQCGWLRTYTSQELAHRFAVIDDTDSLHQQPYTQ